MNWKYAEAFFVVPAMTFHPMWSTLIGKQRVDGSRSTPGFLRINDLIRQRIAKGENVVQGTYRWTGDHWELVGDTGLVGFDACRCPEELPGTTPIIDT